MDDPIILDAHLDFIKRFGERYDGHPDIDHVDLGSIGWWGEWHMSESTNCKLPTLENRMKMVDAYLTAFKKTPLVMLINGQECTGTLCNMAQVGEPIRWETWAVFHQPGTICETPTRNGFGKPKPRMPGRKGRLRRNLLLLLRSLSRKTGRCVGSSIMLWPVTAVTSAASPAIARQCGVSGRTGAVPATTRLPLVLKELKHPPISQPGATIQLAMKWQNMGSAPCYKPYRLAYRLSNGEGFEKVFVGTVTVNKWLPGSIELFTEEFFKEPADLPPGEVIDVADSIQLPHDLSPGTYALSIAVVGTEDTEPIVRLGIKGRSEDGWYPLSTVTISR